MSRLRLDLTHLASGSAAQAGAVAGVAVLSTLWLSPHDRGVMVVAATVPGLVSVLATLGVGNAYRARRPRADPAAAFQLARTYSALVIGTTVVGAAVSAALGLTVSLVTLPDLASGKVLLVMALGGATLCASSTLTDAWFSAGRFAEGSRWSAASAIAGLGAALVVGPESAAGFLAIQYLAMALVLAASIVPLTRSRLLLRPRLDRAQLSSVVHEGAPSVGFLAGTTIMLRADRILLAAFVPPGTVAAYALASTVSEVLRLAPTALGQVALLRGAKDPSAEMRDLNRNSWMLVGAVALVVIPVAAFAIPGIFGPAYSSSTTLLGVMVVGEFCFSSYLVSAMFLIGRGTARRVATIALVGAAVCVPLYVAGAGLGGAIGCAAAGVILYALLGLVVQPARVSSGAVTS